MQAFERMYDQSSRIIEQDKCVTTELRLRDSPEKKDDNNHNAI